MPTSKAVARFIEPMLLEATSALPEGPNWPYEVKLDGYRALVIKSAGKVRLRSRNDKDFNARYPAIVAALGSLADETVIDGEVVVESDATVASIAGRRARPAARRTRISACAPGSSASSNVPTSARSSAESNWSSRSGVLTTSFRSPTNPLSRARFISGRASSRSSAVVPPASSRLIMSTNCVSIHARFAMLTVLCFVLRAGKQS
jgi:bifunctional non-homologous end joining protein LigD